MNILEVEGLSKQRGGFQLNDISFQIPAGYICGYVGQNGAGKTTTIKLIMEQLKHEMGTIRVNGITFEEDEIKYKDQIGYIADECYLPGEYTAAKLAAILAGFYPSFQKKVFYNYLTKWNLPKDQKIKEFSKGMKVRIMFACALSRDTKILIMDEATSGLDPVIRTEILEELQEYIEDGERSVLLSTHIMSDLDQVADFIFFLNQGNKVFFDTKDEILDKYVVIKGGLEDLTGDLEKKLIGAKKTQIGFEGLLETEQLEYIRKDFLVEKPSIEQIIVFYIQGVRKR